MPGTTARAELVIDAPIERVWAVLSDVARYADWSTFVVEIEGTLGVGNVLTERVRMKPESSRTIRVRVRVEAVEEPTRLSWSFIGMPRWLLRSTRHQTLTRVDEHRTRYVSEETFFGPLAPIVAWTNLARVQDGFDRTARELALAVARGD